MSEGWAELRLGDVAVLEYGKSLTEANRKPGAYPVFGSAGAVGTHEEHLGPEGPMIIVGRKGTAGSVHWSARPAWPIDTAYWVRPIASSIDMPFLLLVLQSLDLPGICAQTGVPGLNRDRAYELPVRMPSLATQRRIVDLIAATDESVTWSCEEESRSGRLLAAMSNECLSGSPQVRLSEACTIVAPLVDPRLPEYFDLPHIGVERIESGTGRLLDPRTAREDQVISSKFLFTPEDVVFAKIRPELRKVCFPRIDGLCSADAYPLRAVGGTLPEFLFEALQYTPFAERAIATSGRTKMPKINRNELFSLTIPLPSHARQKEIVDLLGSVRQVRDAAALSVARGQSAREALLSDLLSGDHGIPETYDALLEAS